MTELRWLLEDIKSPVSAPLYFTLDPELTDGDWTRDHDKALGFARKIDAEQFAASYVFDIDDEPVVRVCEHGFGVPTSRDSVIEDHLIDLFACLHHANPTDPSQWHIKPGMHHAFSAIIRALSTRSAPSHQTTGGGK